MEEKLNSGYTLYVQKNNDTDKVIGLYIRETNSSIAKIYTKEQELDFLRILPTISQKITEKNILVMGKEKKKYFACITNDLGNIDITKSGAYNDYCLNTLVDLEEKLTIDNVNEHKL